jgi:hypothetical protein
MNSATMKVLGIFRRYRVGPGEMLFIHNLDHAPQLAMAKLISDGLVLKERAKNAYCLTDTGFAAVQSL